MTDITETIVSAPVDVDSVSIYPTVVKKKCGRCKVLLPISAFKLRRDEEYNKLCEHCLGQMRVYKKSVRDKKKAERSALKETETILKVAPEVL